MFFDILGHKKKLKQATDELKQAVETTIIASKNSIKVSKNLRMSIGESGSISINKLSGDLGDRK